MDLLEPIRIIAMDATRNGTQVQAIQKILYYIAREDENFRLRQQYYHGIKEGN